VDPVAGTHYDFRTPTPIGARIRHVNGGKGLIGYDVIDGDDMRKVAAIRDAKSGRGLELWANQPAMQLYTGNGLNSTTPSSLRKRSGLARCTSMTWTTSSQSNFLEGYFV
jgi:galactose mutarotase-like enzyme